MKNRPEEANGQKDQGAGQEARERESERHACTEREREGEICLMKAMCAAACVCVRALGVDAGKQCTKSQWTGDSRGPDMLYIQREGERNLAYKVS